MKVEINEYNLIGVWIGIAITSVIFFCFHIEVINYIIWFGGGITTFYLFNGLLAKLKEPLKK